MPASESSPSYSAVGVLAKTEKSATEPDKHVSGLLRDLEQVDKLFEELLTYVAFDEFDQDRPELKLESIDVFAAVRTIASEFTEVNADLEIIVAGDEGATVLANPKLFDRATSNLLLNAAAYGGLTIRIDIREFETECVVDVQDGGPGIPELDRPKVIRPFVRLAKKKAKGTGLGLAIVSRIMRLHDGSLHLAQGQRVQRRFNWFGKTQKLARFVAASVSAGERLVM